MPGAAYELVTDGEKLYAAVAMLGKFEERMRVVLVNLAKTIESMKRVDGIMDLREQENAVGDAGFKLLEDAEALKENLEELYYYSGEAQWDQEKKRKENEKARMKFQKEVDAVKIEDD